MWIEPKRISVDNTTWLLPTDIKAEGVTRPHTVWALYKSGRLVRHLTTEESSMITAAYHAGACFVSSAEDLEKICRQHPQNQSL